MRRGIQRTKLDRPGGPLLSTDRTGEELCRIPPSGGQWEASDQINR